MYHSTKIQYAHYSSQLDTDWLPAQFPASVVLGDLSADGDAAERHESRVGDVGHGDLQVLQVGAVLGQLDEHLVVALGLQVDVGEPPQARKGLP